MNIALRPSGGRGEYELAGTHGDLHLQDIFGLPLWVEFLPGVPIDVHSQCLLKDGKPRIRLTQPAKNAHPATLIASAMLLPKPRRERHETHGAQLLRWEAFVVQTVRIDVIVRAGRAQIRPIVVRLENGDDVRLDLDFAERMARVVRVWTAAATIEDEIAAAVRAHAVAFSSPLATQAQMVAALGQVHASLGYGASDLLPQLEAHFGIAAVTASSTGELSAAVEEGDFSEDVEVNPTEARVERVRQWRLAAVRGGSAASFRKKVRLAYDSRCIFTGQRLPRMELTSTAGVDAAHILPWSRFDLDAPINGLCLSKQCHWAFDEGLLRLTYEEPENAYVVSIPQPALLAAEATSFDMAAFHAVCGIVPANRLPADNAQWPSRVYLAELNRFLDGGDS